MFLEEEEIRTQTCRGKTCREDGHLQCKEEAQKKSIFDQYFGLRFIISRNFEKKSILFTFFFPSAAPVCEFQRASTFVSSCVSSFCGPVIDICLMYIFFDFGRVGPGD